MSKTMFIGDVHLSPRTPASRRDDYPTTLLNKLDGLLKLAKDKDVTHIFFLGDIFNAKHMTLPYFIKCYEKFKEFQVNNIELHTVIGNHDILYNTEDTMSESPLQLLFESNLLDNKEHVYIENLVVHQYNYLTLTKNIPDCPKTDGFHILVGHYFYNLGFDDNEHTISIDQCNDLGYQCYILGHDHTPYKPVKQQNYEVHRPGSFSRGTSHTCQVSRDNIQVILIDNNDAKIEYVDVLNVLPASEVYRESSIVSSSTSLSQSLQDFLSALEFNNSSDIFKTLNEIQMSDKVRSILVQYLNDEGLYDLQGG